jgi:NAD(P)-dependent dehydrogenase (short-subunit alcohol dehydrogenase family)
VRVNYLGGVWCLRAFLPALERGRPAAVVNIVSVAGSSGRTESFVPGWYRLPALAQAVAPGPLARLLARGGYRTTPRDGP